MNCLNRFTRCFSSYKSSNSETKNIDKTKSQSPDDQGNIQSSPGSLNGHEVTEVEANNELPANYIQLKDDTIKEIQKKYPVSRFFWDLDTLQVKLAIKNSKIEFLKKSNNYQLKATQDNIDKANNWFNTRVHQKPLDNPNSSACWANTALETLKFCFPFINAENQNQLPELMKFSKGENVNSNVLRKELKQILINSEQCDRINNDGTVSENRNDDPNITLQTFCSQLGLNNNEEKFFNCKLLVGEKPPKELLKLSNRDLVTGDEDNTLFQVPACNKFVMAIMRGDLSYTRCTNLFTPFQIEDSPESPSYQPLAITCNVSAHFVSFQKIGAQWYLKDDLNVLQRRLNEDATIVQKPDLKKAIQLDQPCHLDNEHPEKTWEQYIEEKVVNVLFEKTPTVASTVAPTEEV